MVLDLHAVQPGYDAAHHLMSELALGAQGELTLLAFLAWAIALAALAMGFSAAGADWTVKGVLGWAAMGFVGAGVFPLGATSLLHTALVALAFMACRVALYLLPGSVTEFNSPGFRVISGGLLGVLAFSVALGHSVLPIGTGQCLAAAALLVWVMAWGWRRLRRSHTDGFCQDR